MKAGSGKQKGGRFERDTCRALSLWVSDGKRDDIFWRSSMSGGRATIGLKTGRRRGAQAGDIGAIDGLAELLLRLFYIECKFHRDLNIGQGIIKNNGLLYGFWTTAVRDARNYNRHAMLVARQNNTPTLCIIPTNAMMTFDLDGDVALCHVTSWGATFFDFQSFLAYAKVPSADTVYSVGNVERVKL